MKKSICSIIVLSFLFSSSVSADIFTFEEFEFVAPTQSLWGSNNQTNDFGASGSDGLGILTLSYDIGASAGTVSADFPGLLSSHYSPVVVGPGITSIDLTFEGAGNANMSSNLGAWVNVDVSGFELVDLDYSLDIDETSNAVVGQEISGTDSFTAGRVGVNIIIAEVGINLDIIQDNFFTVLGIDGLLAYSLRGSGYTEFLPFSLSDNISLDLLLDSTGIWDVWVDNVMLANIFYTTFDAALILYEEHPDGVKICRRCISILPCYNYICGLDYDRNELELLNIGLYDDDPFALAFNQISTTEGFSIKVISEPPIILMYLLGLFVLFRQNYSNH